jgi:hypothetical protein
MSKQNTTLLIVALVLMTSGAVFLNHLRAYQKLGQPAVKTRALEGRNTLAVELPNHVLDYESKPIEVSKLVLDTLPPDTSFGQRLYKAPDGFEAMANVVLMGADRTSLHKAEFCLEGQGWKIDRAASRETNVHIERPQPYDLPVMKYIVNQKGARGIYLYWFVAENEITASHGQRMWWMARDLLRTGVLQRWSYVSYFSICEPGQEQAILERLKALIAASVPEFQLTPRPERATASVR